MVKIKDVLGTECEEQDTMIIINSLDDPVKVCKTNYEKYHKKFEDFNAGMSVLDDINELESILTVY